MALEKAGPETEALRGENPQEVKYKGTLLYTYLQHDRQRHTMEHHDIIALATQYYTMIA